VGVWLYWNDEMNSCSAARRALAGSLSMCGGREGRAGAASPAAASSDVLICVTNVAACFACRVSASNS
jgi:hypothetical protein